MAITLSAVQFPVSMWPDLPISGENELSKNLRVREEKEARRTTPYDSKMRAL